MAHIRDKATRTLLTAPQEQGAVDGCTTRAIRLRLPNQRFKPVRALKARHKRISTLFLVCEYVSKFI